MAAIFAVCSVRYDRKKMTLNYMAPILRFVNIDQQLKNACEILLASFNALLLVLGNFNPPKINKVRYINFHIFRVHIP